MGFIRHTEPNGHRHEPEPVEAWRDLEMVRYDDFPDLDGQDPWLPVARTVPSAPAGSSGPRLQELI